MANGVAIVVRAIHELPLRRWRAWAKKILSLQVALSYLLLIFSTSAGAATLKFEYDQAGNMISGQGRYYEYNDANQLVKVRKDAPSGPVIAEYVYDYQGQRVKKIENGITTYYIGKHYEERKGNTVNEKTNYIFVNGQRVAASIKKDNEPAKVSYYLNNHLGSADVVVDEQGNVTDKVRYYPYGEYRTQPNAQRHTYTGKEWDEATEQYYYEARYYNPFIRRFAQADAAAPNLYNPQSLNRYSYTENNPIRYIDPNGESATLAGALIGGLTGGAIALWQGQDMRHVAGAAAHGAIAGAIMGSVIDTGGASLGVMALAGAGSNVAGGLVGRAVSGDQILSTESIGTDAASGAIGSAIGYAAGRIATKGLNSLSPAMKGKIGEMATEIKYAFRGYRSQGKAIVPTGGWTSTGLRQTARYDHKMVNFFTGKTLTVESKFNGAWLTKNQILALDNIDDGFLVLDRTTSKDIGRLVNMCGKGVWKTYENKKE